MGQNKFIRTLLKYTNIWWKYVAATSQIAFASRFGAAIFISGKLLRFGFFLLFLLVLGSKTRMVAGYTLWQIIFFYLTFNLVDVLPQFFLREVYRFGWYVTTGDFDLVLTKPISPLFRALLGGSDVFDLSILTLSIFFIWYAAGRIGPISPLGIALYIALVVNAFIIALAFHICVVGVAILSTKIDNAIMLYRDLTQMGRFPVDIYHEPLRGIITFAIPIGIMMTFPAKALMGLLSWQFIALSFWIGAVFLTLAFEFWKFALRHYGSASS